MDYTLTDVECHFRSVPEDGDQTPVILQNVVSLKNTISSQNATISSNVPSRSANGVTMSFIKVSDDNSAATDQNRLSSVHASQLQFLFNSSSSFINYVLKSRTEMLLRMLGSYNPSNSETAHQIDSSSYFSNSKYMLGTAFDGLINLSENTFECQVQTGISEPHFVFMYFHSLISI